MFKFAMCRLFAQISPTAADAKHYLTDSCFSLLRQSNFNKKNPQKDGWGIGYFGNDGTALVSKSAKPVFRESRRFQQLASQTRSRVVIAHLRAASNPLGLTRKRLLAERNSQPFTDGRWLFAHNGTLRIPREIARRLGGYRKKVSGDNDSEIYFWQFIKFLRRGRGAAWALRACIREIWTAWASCRRRYPGIKNPYTSLNALVSDGRRLYALNHFVERGLSDVGVCNPDQPWSVMSFSRRAGRLIAASENMDRKTWTRLRPPEILSASIENGRLSVRRKRFQLTTANGRNS